MTGVVLLVRAMFASRETIVAENLALRHQLGVLQRSVTRPLCMRNIPSAAIVKVGNWSGGAAG